MARSGRDEEEFRVGGAPSALVDGRDIGGVGMWCRNAQRADARARARARGVLVCRAAERAAPVSRVTAHRSC